MGRKEKLKLGSVLQKNYSGCLETWLNPCKLIYVQENENTVELNESCSGKKMVTLLSEEI